MALGPHGIGALLSSQVYESRRDRVPAAEDWAMEEDAGTRSRRDGAHQCQC